MVNRSFGTGRFISRSSAARWPATTSRETIGGSGNSSAHRSASSGRFVTRDQAVSQGERAAAARARVTADAKRGVSTPAWIVELAGD